MLPKTMITVQREIKNNSVTQRASSSYQTILDGACRRVTMEKQPGNPYMQVTQRNPKAEYIVYFEKGDPEIREGDIITFRLLNKPRRVVVKELVPMTLTIARRNLEAWCDADK